MECKKVRYKLHIVRMLFGDRATIPDPVVAIPSGRNESDEMAFLWAGVNVITRPLSA